MSFVIIVTIENGIELGSNFQIRNTMTNIIKVSSNRFVCIVACNSTTMLTKFCPQRSSSFSNIKHAIATSIVYPTRESLIRYTTIPGVGCYGLGFSDIFNAKKDIKGLLEKLVSGCENSSE